jgi:hypothetical protein
VRGHRRGSGIVLAAVARRDDEYPLADDRIPELAGEDALPRGDLHALDRRDVVHHEDALGVLAHERGERLADSKVRVPLRSRERDALEILRQAAGIVLGMYPKVQELREPLAFWYSAAIMRMACWMVTSNTFISHLTAPE